MISTALANVTVYRCLEGGDLCLTKTCCLEIQESISCCSEQCSTMIVNDECCDEIEIVHDTVFSCSGVKEPIAIYFSTCLDDFVDESLLSKNLIFSNIIRGPPVQEGGLIKTTPPIYIQHCSFLC